MGRAFLARGAASGRKDQVGEGKSIGETNGGKGESGSAQKKFGRTTPGGTPK